MRIELRGTEPGKPHIQHVALIRDDGTRVEIPVRKATLRSLSAAKQVVYVNECAEYHAGTGEGWMERRNARRAAWDADDKAREEAKFIMRHVATTDAGVRVSVTWKGFTAEHLIANDPANAAANAQAAHDAEKARRDALVAETAAFNIG